MKKIVVGLGGSANVDSTLERAATMADAFGSRLIVVAVQEIVTAIPLGTIADAGMASPSVPEETWSRELLIDEARRFLDARCLDYEIVSPVGDAGHEISAVADECDADLIIVPAASRGFLERWLIGSVSDNVVRTAHRDVLLVADLPAAEPQPHLRMADERIQPPPGRHGAARGR